MNAIVVSALLGVLMMFVGLFSKNSRQVQWVALLGVTGLMIASIFDFTHFEAGHRWFGMIEFTAYTSFFNTVITFCTMMYVFMFHRFIANTGRHDAEYFALIFFVLCGVYLLASYTNLLVLFIGIEILSIPQYILAGSDKENFKSNEASLKYFLMGSFSTGILLMGITLIYGACGTFDVMDPKFIGQFQSLEGMGSLTMVGILLLIMSFAFKVSAAPMHLWTADVYDGSPTSFTPFMATIVKVSVFLAFLKLFHVSFGAVGGAWQITITAMIALTLLIGNITAVYQQSVKRMMAYSSIAQAGFMLFAVFALNEIAWKGLILYSAAYTLASLGVFIVLVRMKDFTYDGFNGLAKRHPLMAATATICLLSLAGIPLTGGFFAKFYVLSAAMQQGKMIWLVVFAVLMAAISAYYYFKVIISMYFNDGESELVDIPGAPEQALMVLNAALVIALGILPSLITG